MELLHKELSESVIGASMSVLNELKPGLDEKVYENALIYELRERGHEVDQQARYPVYYKETQVGLLIPDLIVDGLIIVDTKVVSDFNASHTAQMVGYLAITGHELGLLINFKSATLKWKRIVREHDSLSYPNQFPRAR
ncbi:MAG: GxxExxY protein [Verrucomicrobia bacterium]|nr:GxxExxY protein [Verrucomicrobiota bacterium]